MNGYRHLDRCIIYIRLRSTSSRSVTKSFRFLPLRVPCRCGFAVLRHAQLLSLSVTFQAPPAYAGTRLRFVAATVHVLSVSKKIRRFKQQAAFNRWKIESSVGSANESRIGSIDSHFPSGWG